MLKFCLHFKVFLKNMPCFNEIPEGHAERGSGSIPRIAAASVKMKTVRHPFSISLQSNSFTFYRLRHPWERHGCLALLGFCNLLIRLKHCVITAGAPVACRLSTEHQTPLSSPKTELCGPNAVPLRISSRSAFFKRSGITVYSQPFIISLLSDIILSEYFLRRAPRIPL